MKHLALAATIALLATPAAAQGTIELQHGEEVTISCALAPSTGCGDGTCDAGEDPCSCAADCGAPPSSETGLCADGVDNNCDGMTDCGDADCSADPACSPPTGSAPDAWVRIHYEALHTVNCVSGDDIQMGGPGSPGDCIHHFIDLSGNGREFTQFDAAAWAEVGAASIDVSPIVGEFDQYLINPDAQMTVGGEMFDVPRGGTWTIAYAGKFRSPTSGWIGTDGTCQGTKYNLGMDWFVPSAGGGGAFTTNLEGSGDITLTTVQPLQHARVGLVFAKHADGSYDVWQRVACSGWVNVTSGVTFDRRVCFNLFPAYYPNGWGEGENYTSSMLFREFAMSDTDAEAEAWKTHIEGEHGGWIDDGCGG